MLDWLFLYFTNIYIYPYREYIVSQKRAAQSFCVHIIFFSPQVILDKSVEKIHYLWSGHDTNTHISRNWTLCIGKRKWAWKLRARTLSENLSQNLLPSSAKTRSLHVLSLQLYKYVPISLLFLEVLKVATTVIPFIIEKNEVASLKFLHSVCMGRTTSTKSNLFFPSSSSSSSSNLFYDDNKTKHFTWNTYF